MCRRLFIYLFIVLLSCFVLEEFLGTVICESGECRTGQREDLSCDLVQETPPLISQELSSLGSLRVALSAAKGIRASSFCLVYFTCFYDQSNLREKAVALAHSVRVRSMARGMSRKLEPEAAGYMVSVIQQQRVKIVSFHLLFVQSRMGVHSMVPRKLGLLN